jgi:hypothetical protein
MADAPETLKADPDARCDRCGALGALDLGDRRLCEDCCAAFGSCCLEFGADNLWSDDRSPSRARNGRR